MTRELSDKDKQELNKYIDKRRLESRADLFEYEQSEMEFDKKSGGDGGSSRYRQSNRSSHAGNL